MLIICQLFWSFLVNVFIIFYEKRGSFLVSLHLYCYEAELKSGFDKCGSTFFHLFFQENTNSPILTVDSIDWSEDNNSYLQPKLECSWGLNRLAAMHTNLTMTY